MAEPHQAPASAGNEGGDGLLPDSAPCPFCDGTNTHVVNPFGGQLSVAQYWCRDCRTAFEFIKWDDHDGDA